MGVSAAYFRSSGTASLHFWSSGGVRGFFLATLGLHFECHGYLGRLGGGLGDHLGPQGLLFSAHLELWRHLALHFRSSGGVQGSILVSLGLHFGCSGGSWAHWGGPWGSLGAHMASLGRPKGPKGIIFGSFWLHFGCIVSSF